MNTVLKKYGSWLFLGGVIFLYLILGITYPELADESIQISRKILRKVLPIFFVVFVIMITINYIIEPAHIKKFIGKGSGWKGWFFSITTGIISMGPPYLFYPLLSELKSQKARTAHIAAFLASRAIKFHLFPILIIYFSLRYTIVLTVAMIVSAILQGWLVEKIVDASLKSDDKGLKEVNQSRITPEEPERPLQG